MGKHFSQHELEKMIYRIELRVTNLEQKNDYRRNSVLKILKLPIANEAKIEIFNETDIEIPARITQILQYGINRPVGGTPDKFSLLTACDKLYKAWSEDCNDHIDALTQLEVRANLFVDFVPWENVTLIITT